MKSYELVGRTLRGEKVSKTPVYGWIRSNLEKPLTGAYGSVEAFEDKYDFDMAHIFGGPSPYDEDMLDGLRKSGEEITPALLLDLPMNRPDRGEDYISIKRDLAFYRGERERFCYLQTPGIFECLNSVFGIENHLLYLALYPDELKQVYQKQATWNCDFAGCGMELGADMIHISDDWGAQRSLMFSYPMWKEMIYPYIAQVVGYVKEREGFLSLHSDGCILPVIEDLVGLGFDALHPWQETAGMSYGLFLEKYQEKFAIFGGVCVQSTLGFGEFTRLESELQRVFAMLKNKRWLCCTTHYVQDHCTIEELTFAFDLINKLAKEG